MKLVWLALRLMALGLLLCMFGCGGSKGETDPDTRKTYTLQYTCTNLEDTSVIFEATDVPTGVITGPLTTASGASSNDSTQGYYTTDAHTSVLVVVFDSSHRELTRIRQDGVNVGEGLITTVKVTYDGTQVKMVTTGSGHH
ncbi:MAG: hypothetical protein QM758_15340 [Armatimonas sp.]